MLPNLISGTYPYGGRHTMAIGMVARPASWSRILGFVAVFAVMLVAGALPARAGYDWCSVDPTLPLHRADGGFAHAMDIQVMVPRSILPMKGTARLSVAMPSNING